MKIPLEVLLVEDNEGDVILTQRALRDHETQCRLTVVNDGAEALDYLRHQNGYADAIQPDLILLDLNMPRMNGKELLEIIKQDDELKSIAVVVLTSSQAPADIAESYARHASCYVVKPFAGDEFRNAVRQIVSFWGNLAEFPQKAA
jgi:CheY-like chemotaxis protein